MMYDENSTGIEGGIEVISETNLESFGIAFS
jgi:hypothetical protein